MNKNILLLFFGIVFLIGLTSAENIVIGTETAITGGSYSSLGGVNLTFNTSITINAVSSMWTDFNGSADGLTNVWLCDTPTCVNVYNHASKLPTDHFFNFSSPTTFTAGNSTWILMNVSSAIQRAANGGLGLPITYKYGNIQNDTFNGATRADEIDDIGTIYVSPPGTSVTITLNFPTNASVIQTASTQFNTTNIVNSGNLTNSTLYVWFSNGTLFGTNFTILTGQTNQTNQTISGLVPSGYIWNQLTYFSNSSGGNINKSFATNNFTFTYGSNTFATSYNSSAYETSLQSFQANFTELTGYVPSNGFIYYNGTAYPSTITQVSGQNYSIVSSPVIIPPVGSSPQNISFFFRWMSNSTQDGSQVFTQQVNPISFAYCSSGTPYITYSFLDETNLSALNGSIQASTFNYWLGNGTQFKTLFYNNNTANGTYSFCLTPANLTLNSNYSISYAASGYATRTSTSGNIQLTNTTTNQPLYLLQTTQGLVVTFQVVNSATQPISGVYATANKTISGTPTMVASGYTGGDGGITFFVDPLLTYTFYFTKTGYTPFTLTTTPSQTSYTITLGVNTTTNNDYTKGISYNILPAIGTFLDNNTFYNFSYSINSSFWSLSYFGYSIFDENNNLLVTNSSTNALGGTLVSLLNVSNHSSITMNYYYLINSTWTNATVSWTVNNLAGTGFSIKNFFTDLSLYLNSGYFFGMTSFALSLLVFVAIFITAGIFTYKFGFTSPEAMVAIIFGLVYLFDVELNLVPTPINAVPHFATIAMGLVAIGVIFRERTG